MWIKHIILENFASVKVGMKVNRIEIDFSKRKNKICLLVAPNGTGKTSLLSTFTPFASLGNLDVRDGGNLILEGKQGYKEITIVDRGHEYFIKHFYSPNKDSHSVKSYIEKDGEELNVNGNVRSFLSIVESELGIEPNFHKLNRLGNNVTNLLQLSATERKKFLSNLLQDLDVYLNYYKKLTDDSRILKTQISHLTDNMRKTGIDNLDETKSLLSYLQKEIEEIENERLQNNIALAQYQNIINSYDVAEYEANVTQLKKEISKATKALEKKDSSLTLSECKKKSEKLEECISSLEKTEVSLNTQYDTLLISLDESYKMLDSLETQLKKEKNNESLISARNIFYSLRKEVNENKSTYDGYNPGYTKDELNDLISTLIRCQQLLDTVYEFGEYPIKEVIKLLRNKEDVNRYINQGLLDYDYSKKEASSLLNKFMNDMNHIPISCKHEECSLYKIWKDVKDLLNKEEKIRSSYDTEETYKYMQIIYQKILEVLEIIKTKEDIIKRLPIERKRDFLIESIFDNISHMEVIFKRESYNVLLTEITEYNHFKEQEMKCLEAEKTYEALMKTSRVGFLEDQIKVVKEKIQTTVNSCESIKDKSQKISIQLSEYNGEKDFIDTMIIALSNMDEMTNQYNEAKKTLDLYYDAVIKYRSASKEKERIESLLTKKKNDEIRIKVSIETHKSLQKELDKFMTLYNENFYIKKAMSSKEGIPLEFINIYMSNIKKTINELLDIVYHGDLCIDDFKINSDEFRIPYMKEGYLIPDIIQASQGETAFFSIALSFALISESILKYNIILLDEIDGNLDDEKRKRFIDVLERLIDMIDAEQIFLISHNNLFSMYPVDVISLNDEIDGRMQLANYIPVIKD